MTIARRKQICLGITPYYHCMTRCVRRGFLCGEDAYSGRNFEHRRGWIEERLLLLSQVFCIDIAGYAIMSNHYHVVVRVDTARAEALSTDEVIKRWRRIYKGPEVIQLHLAGLELESEQLEEFNSVVAQWRDNLSNLSRFMGNLNESIARRANKEDDCTGAFWESRFKTQAILDVPALLRTLCYVDLNPVRAKMAKTPESSHHTSVRRRLKFNSSGLLPFQNELPERASAQSLNELPAAAVLPIDFADYLNLLDWTGRELLRSKRGSIDTSAPEIMLRLGYTSQHWMSTQKPRVAWMQKAIGQAESLKKYCAAMGQRWIWQSC